MSRMLTYAFAVVYSYNVQLYAKCDRDTDELLESTHVTTACTVTLRTRPGQQYTVYVRAYNDEHRACVADGRVVFKASWCAKYNSKQSFNFVQHLTWTT
jgi:hypothetical protein